MNRCESCPVSSDLPCRGGIFCQWSEGGDSVHIQHIIAVAEKDAGRSVSYVGVGIPCEQVTPAVTPGIVSKVANFGKAIVTHVMAGMPSVDEIIYENRMKICGECNFMSRDQETGQPSMCQKCGCNLTIKIRWADQRCPIGKW